MFNAILIAGVKSNSVIRSLWKDSPPWKTGKIDTVRMNDRFSYCRVVAFVFMLLLIVVS